MHQRPDALYRRYFGTNVDGLVSGLLDDQLDDGGWNCETENGATVSSFDSTICVLEGLLEYELAGGRVAVAAARRRGEEYLLQRQLFRRRSTGEVSAERWLEFSWPPRWHYDVLRALDHFRRTGDAPDARVAEAVQLVHDKRQPDGTWLLENTHPGETQFEFKDGDERPSRWNTLRAACPRLVRPAPVTPATAPIIPPARHSRRARPAARRLPGAEPGNFADASKRPTYECGDTAGSHPRTATENQELIPMSFTIEEERGTFTGTPRQHNGYYAGDFSQVRMRTAPELAILTRMQRPVTRTHPLH